MRDILTCIEIVAAWVFDQMKLDLNERLAQKQEPLRLVDEPVSRFRQLNFGLRLDNEQWNDLAEVVELTYPRVTLQWRAGPVLTVVIPLFNNGLIAWPSRIEGSSTTVEAISAATETCLLILPNLPYRDLKIHTPTGLVLRCLGQFGINDDAWTARFDLAVR